MLYRLRPDQKISDVVSKLDMPYALIRRYNPFVEGLENTYAGRTLRLPLTYAVLPGETYETISAAFGILPLYMKELNPYLDGQMVIYPGQTVYLPPELVY